MAQVKAMGPEKLPVKQPQLKLRETVKPSNREHDKGGILVAIGSALVLVAGWGVSHTAEIVQLLASAGLDPVKVDLVAKGLALFGALYVMVTKTKS